MQLDEHTFWAIYNLIREIEYTFRVLKTDLDLRPIYHKTDDASMTRLNLGLLAYWSVATIRYQLKQSGINSDWREIVRKMNTQKYVTTSIENISQQTIPIRQCTEPTKEVKEIYDKLKYKYQPFARKKSVVLPVEIFKTGSLLNQPFLSITLQCGLMPGISPKIQGRVSRTPRQSLDAFFRLKKIRSI